MSIQGNLAMPIYEYECSNCRYKIEVLQKVSDDRLAECPACQQQELKKLISAVSFRLKGGGWYETDFKTEGKKQLAESDSAVAAASSEDPGADGSKPQSGSTGPKSNSDKLDTAEKKSVKEESTGKDVNPRENSTPKSASKKLGDPK